MFLGSHGTKYVRASWDLGEQLRSLLGQWWKIHRGTVSGSCGQRGLQNEAGVVSSCMGHREVKFKAKV